MGNTPSSNINYDLDTEIVNTEYKIDTKKINELNDYDKLFITYNDSNIIFGILIKIINNKLYIYLKNIFNNDFKLAKIVVMSKYNNTNIKNYINHIHISKEHDMISIPEYDMINIYSLSEIINNCKLKQTNKTGLLINHIDNSLVINHKNDLVSKDDMYKCYLCRNMFIIILISGNRYNKIIGIEYTSDTKYTVDNVNVNIIANNTKIHVSTISNIIVFYDYVENCIYITDVKNGIISKNIDSDIIKNTFCLSDDGLILFYISNNRTFNVYDMKNNKQYDNTIDINTFEFDIDIENIQFKIFNYTKFNDMNIIDNHEIYILTGWDMRNKKLYYWFIKYNDIECMFYRTDYISMIVNDDIIYNYNNRFIYVFKTINGIITYDLEKILPIKIANIMKNDILKEIKTGSNSNNYINIRCADNKTRKYILNNIMTIFIDNNKDIYDVDYTVNIDIYDNNKSFDIFQKLLDSNKNIDNIIIDICNIEGITNKYNIMEDLLDHIYEFIKKLIIYTGDKNNNELKAYYIGYVLMIFILKFYTYLVKISNRIDIKRDIICNFNENFPPFSDFMNNSIKSIL